MLRGRESSTELEELEVSGSWHANTPLPAQGYKRIEHSVNRGCSLGEEDWMQQAAGQLSLQSTLRPRG